MQPLLQKGVQAIQIKSEAPVARHLLPTTDTLWRKQEKTKFFRDYKLHGSVSV